MNDLHLLSKIKHVLLALLLIAGTILSFIFHDHATPTRAQEPEVPKNLFVGRMIYPEDGWFDWKYKLDGRTDRSFASTLHLRIPDEADALEVPGFCVEHNVEIDDYTPFTTTSAGTRSCQVTWLLNNYPTDFPTTNQEAKERAALQFAIWYFTDGVVTIDERSFDDHNTIRERVQQIIDSVPDVCEFETAGPPVMTLDAATDDALAVGATHMLTVKVTRDGQPYANQVINVATDFGTLDNGRTFGTVVTGSDGTATVRVQADSEGKAKLFAFADYELPVGTIFSELPGRSDQQDVVLAKPTNVTLKAKAVVKWDATITPTATPTATQTVEPTDYPVPPTDTPTDEPTVTTTTTPTDEPTGEPTGTPTDEPTDTPTDEPTDTPTDEPTDTPTDEPTDTPTDTPTDELTDTPTDEPTDTPTETVTPVTPTPGPVRPCVEAKTDKLWYANQNIWVEPDYNIEAGKEFDFYTRLTNSSDKEETVTIRFMVSNFGMGQTWTEIGRIDNVTFEAGETLVQHMDWKPTRSGHFCLRIYISGSCGEYWQQRNLDVLPTPVEPCTHVERDFIVENSTQVSQTYTLNLIQDSGSCSASLDKTKFTLQSGDIEDVSIRIYGSQKLGETCSFRVESEQTNDGVFFEARVGTSIKACLQSPDGTPTAQPTVPPNPSATPTATPSVIPTATPSATPTANPSVIPTANPSVIPTANPSVIPTANPSATPTATPSVTPDPSKPCVVVKEDTLWYANQNIWVEPDQRIEAGKEFEFFTRLTNNSDKAETVTIRFMIADFGMGQTWTEIGRLENVTFAAGETRVENMTWMPPRTGHFCVRIYISGPCGEYWQQRNLDVVSTPVQPCTETSRSFVVENSKDYSETIKLNLIQHSGNCTATLSKDEVTLLSGEREDLSLTIRGSQKSGETCSFRVESEQTGDGIVVTAKVGNNTSACNANTPTPMPLPACDGKCDEVRILAAKPTCDATIRSTTSGNWGSKETWDQQRVPGPTDVVLIEEGHTVTGLKSKVRVQELCNEGTLMSQPASTLNIYATGAIFNDSNALILGMDGNSGSASTNGQHGGSIELHGSPIYNLGTMQAGAGGDDDMVGGTGGMLKVLGANTLNAGTMAAGDGGDIIGTQLGARAGNGGEAHIWGKYHMRGGSLQNVGLSHGGNGGNVHNSFQMPGIGGRLKLISLPNVYLQCGTHYGGNGGCRDDGSCTRRGDVVIEPNNFCMAGNTRISGNNVTLFGTQLNLDMSKSDGPVIVADNDVVLSPGCGSTIDLGNNSIQTVKAGNSVTLYGDVLLADNVSLQDKLGSNVTIGSCTVLADVSLLGPNSIDLMPNETAHISLTVLNSGPVSDTYRITVQDQRGWVVDGWTPTIGVNGIDILDLSVGIRPTETISRVVTNVVTITLTSETNPDLVETMQVVVTVKPAGILLPFVGRPSIVQTSMQTPDDTSDGAVNSTPESNLTGSPVASPQVPANLAGTVAIGQFVPNTSTEWHEQWQYELNGKTRRGWGSPLPLHIVNEQGVTQVPGFCVEHEVLIGALGRFVAAERGQHSCEVSWLLRNYPTDFPNSLPEARERAAIQFALWYFSDGLVTTDDRPFDATRTIRQRVQEIISSVPASCQTEQTAPMALNLTTTSGENEAFIRTIENLTLQVTRNGQPVANHVVHVSTNLGTFENGKRTGEVVTGADGTVTFQMTSRRAGMSHIFAYVDDSIETGTMVTELHNTRDQQNLVIGKNINATVKATTQIEWQWAD